jgi:uncharacterized protein involved in exopolysaccharide biosynthesis
VHFSRSRFLRDNGDATLDTQEELQQSTADDASDLIPITRIVMALWRRRLWVAAVTGVGLLFATGIAFLIPNQYTSTVQLMPPDEQSLSNPSMLTSISGLGSGLLSPSISGGLMNQRTP